MTKEKQKELLLFAVHASLLAGKAIMEVYNSSVFEVEMKKNNSPLTLADRKAHTIIAAELETTKLPIVSEEGKDIPFDERKDYAYFWMVDPLDGTKEFIHRNGEFTVNIALIAKDTPVAGVIFVPALGELYFGIDGEGAYKKSITYSDIFATWDDLVLSSESLPLAATHDDFVVVASRSHMSEETASYIAKCESDGKTLRTLYRGSSLKLCMVAEGMANLYPRFEPTMEWDTAAGHAIAVAAGCKVLKAEDSTPMKYNKEKMLNPCFIVFAMEKQL